MTTKRRNVLPRGGGISRSQLLRMLPPPAVNPFVIATNTNGNLNPGPGNTAILGTGVILGEATWDTTPALSRGSGFTIYTDGVEVASGGLYRISSNFYGPIIGGDRANLWFELVNGSTSFDPPLVTSVMTSTQSPFRYAWNQIGATFVVLNSGDRIRLQLSHKEGGSNNIIVPARQWRVTLEKVE